MRQVVYIVGAGLTKALEPAGGPKVPLMNDFTWVLADYVAEDDVALTTLSVLVDVLGWSVPDEIRKLAHELASGDRRTQPRRQALADYFSRCPAENIEDLILRAEQESEDIQVRFVFAIAGLFHSIGRHLNLNPLRRLVETQNRLAEHQHAVISFNYDLAFETVLHEMVGWNAASGYGAPLLYMVEAGALADHEDNFPTASGGVKGVGLLETSPIPPSSTTNCRWAVLKPHGSLDWLAARKKSEEQVVYVCDSDGKPAYPRDASATTLVCEDVQYSYLTVLVLPPGAKNRPSPFGDQIRVRQKEALQDADEVYVIGWSLPQTDAYETSLLRVVMADRRTRPIVTVVNYRADLSYFERVSDIFGIPSSELKVFNDGFCAWLESRGPVS